MYKNVKKKSNNYIGVSIPVTLVLILFANNKIEKKKSNNYIVVGIPVILVLLTAIFLIHDLVTSHELSVVHWPTDSLRGDCVNCLVLAEVDFYPSVCKIQNIMTS